MKNFREKRNSERFYLKAPIKYRIERVKETHEANMFNCSKGGLYFETNSPLKPGIDVTVSAAGRDGYFRASIKWCRRVGPIDESIYGVGAEYYK